MGWTQRWWLEDLLGALRKSFLKNWLQSFLLKYRGENPVLGESAFRFWLGQKFKRQNFSKRGNSSFPLTNSKMSTCFFKKIVHRFNVTCSSCLFEIFVACQLLFWLIHPSARRFYIGLIQLTIPNLILCLSSLSVVVICWWIAFFFKREV